jgi:hypothetical protein
LKENELALLFDEGVLESYAQFLIGNGQMPQESYLSRFYGVYTVKI